MGVNRNIEKLPKDAKCICKKCGKKFTWPVKTDLCEDCRYGDMTTNLSSAERIFWDLHF